MNVQVTASFTAEPLERPLRFLLQTLEHSSSLDFSPFNQVVQQLLDPRSDVRTRPSAAQVFLVRARDLAPKDPEVGIRAFRDALADQTEILGGPALVIFCPHAEDEAQDQVCEEAQAAALSHLGHAVIQSRELLEMLSADELFDLEADDAGKVPYTDIGFAALAIRVARRLHAWQRPSRKLIVTDADHTLWHGVLGEDGLHGIKVDGPAHALQQFLLERREEGFLLALSSKNDAADVSKALAEHPNMVLRAEHFVAQRVNWEPKSENISSLCQELGLGLDSVIFIDDNPAETAEVSAGCPGVFALTLPESREAIPRVLNQCWAFDHGAPLTKEDTVRSELYAEQASREALLAESASFTNFLESLELKVDLAEVQAAEHERIAQLSTRTNQFNASKRPFTPRELAGWRTSGAMVHRVRASDRFGDYGLVGAMISQREDEALSVSAFFLSCRALGKGVERSMVRLLGKIAKNAGLDAIRVDFTDAARNGVCRAFFEEIGATYDENAFVLPTNIAEGVSLIPEVPHQAPEVGKASSESYVARINLESVVAPWLDPRRLAYHLAAARSPRPDLSEPVVAANNDLEKRLLGLWEEVLGLEGLGVEDRFSSLGGKSLQLVKMHARLTREFDSDLPLTDLFELPTVRALAKRLGGEGPAERESTQVTTTSERPPSEPIAIVGMAVRAPGANSVEEFWANLRDGERTLHSFSDEELASAGVDVAAVRQDPGYVPVKGCLDKIQEFDAAFFGILPKEAKHMDPQQRIFLELAWETLERGGYDPNTYAGKIGLWAGSYLDTYVIANLLTDKAFHAQWIPSIQVGSLQTELGNDKDYLATRVSFKLNLRGPSMTVQTACSTSMVAIAQAIQSLRAGESDMAMAGGVTITLPEKKGYYYTPDGMLSKDGRVCTFSDEATGTVFGNGAGIVLLKRLSEAQRDGDHIHAVIRGAALNNDGGVKHSYTAPSVDGQVEVVTMAQQDAGVAPESIGYIEAHGTGTPLGDPIEVAALTKCFRRQTDATSFCTLGSLKPNIGHLDVASGVCGVIKTALALEHAQIPPLLHYERANPKIDFETSPFRIQTTLTDWVSEKGPRRAGVSSFGVGGTNGHVVLEEAPAEAKRPLSKRPVQLFLMSARTETARDEVAARLTQVDPKTNFADAAFTTAIGRRAFAKRRICVAADWASLSEAKQHDGVPASAQGALNFMFPGQGAQHVGMARELYDCEPVFRDHIDFCANYLEAQIGADLREVLYPAVADEAATDRLKETVFAQPAIFVIETGLAKLWQSWGLQPEAMIGHSVGEFAAACLAGVFSLEEGLTILATRGKLMGDLPGGAMLSVRLSEDAIQPYLGEADLAAVNGKELCVLAGSHDIIARVQARLEADGVTVKHLHTSHGFHSRMMDPVIEPFAAEIAKASLRAPEVPIFSTVTGDWLTDADACDPHYWARHLRQPVRFFESIRSLAATQESQTFIEIGPGQTLATLARQSVGREGGHAYHASSAHPSGGGSDYEQLLTTLGRLWTTGRTIDWQSYYAVETHRRVVLPPYPFERKRHWVDPVPLTADPNASLQITETSTPLPTTTMADIPTPPPRTERLAAKMRESLSELSDIPEEELDGDASFLELGFDSLLLTQVSKAFQDDFGTKVTMRQLMDELPSIDAMVAHLDATLDPSAFAPEEAAELEPTPVAAAPAPAAAASPLAQPAPVAASAVPAPAPVAVPVMPQASVDSGLLGTVINQQMTLMQQQLTLLQGGGAALPAAAPPAPAPPVEAPLEQKSAPAPTPEPAPTPQPKSEAPAPAQAAHGPYKPINRTRDEGLTEKQQAFIADLTKRYNAKTAGSKERTQKYRHCFADPRTANGFNRLWKDMCYQIVVEKAKGSRLTDIDGNDYIDIVNGFGPGFLGHSPDFVTEALKEQLDKTIAVGPQSELAGETAELVCKLIGAERVCFVNTGSEAVQGAIRLARTVTGKDKVVVFSKDYHGNFDEVLVRGSNKKGKFKSLPIAPGIPRRAVEDVIVLDYGTDEALQTIREIAGDIAAVMIEPMQSRRPEFQPVEFVKEIRKITEEAGCLFIFDEVITGFRTGPGGAQEYYGVKADLATYGKVIGGGMPVGLVAGKAEYMDTFDGGHWQYGDDSFPEKPVTFFAGTFVRHPLAIAAVHAMAKFFLEKDRSFWDDIYAKAARLAGTIDQFFQEEGIGIRMVQFSSQMFVRVSEEEKYGGLLFCQLREKGVFILEGLPCYLTTSHTDEDIDFVINAVKEAVADMREGGFFGGAAAAGSGLGKSLGSQGLTGDRQRATKRTSCSHPNVEPITVATTDAQREFWYACQFGENASCAYNEATTLRFRGHLRVADLTKALQQIVDRHGALRSTFSEDGETFTVHPTLSIEVPQEDLSDLSQEDQERRLAEQADFEGSTAFDLCHGPLIRAKLFQLGSEEHLLYLTAHHIICDGWSYNVLVEELSALYNEACTGVPATLEEPKQIFEYTKDEKDFETSEDHQNNEDFWLERFAKSVPVVDLPLDRPFPNVRTFRGSTERHVIGEDLYKAVKKMGAKRGATLYATLCAGFHVLLHRLTHQEAFVLGLPCAGQQVEGSEKVIGNCVNFLPLRNDLSGKQTFTELLKSVKGNLFNAFDHQRYTFGKLLSKLPLKRDPNRSPLVELEFNVERMDYFGEFHGLDTAFEPSQKRFIAHNLFLNIIESKQGLTLDCDYSTELFDGETIQRWLAHFESILEAVVQDPEQRLSEIPVLTESESLALIEAWNAPAPAHRDFYSAEPSGDFCLHRQIEKTVARLPEKVALRSGDQSWTYLELNERANRVAENLKTLGVQPDQLVGVCLNRTPEMMAVLLGILKAGGAYLPLDPEYPRERIELILEDAKPRVILAESATQEILGSASEAKVILLDQDAGFVSRLEASAPTKVHSRNLAYVIYTSGSTGKPKGVQIEHHSVVNLMHAMGEMPGITEDDVVATLTTISFDMSVPELFLPLVHGATMALGERAIALDPALLGKFLTKHGVNWMQGTPTTWNLLLESKWKGKRDLKILCGGEAMPAELPEKLLPLCGELWNIYGPTETTVWSTCHRIGQAKDPIVLGKPLANNRVYLLDESGMLALPGSSGRLFIGGESLARGYANRPDQTNARFVSDPFVKDPNARMYDTGDLARWLATGELQGLGRSDDQVKIRGYRIELGDIESALKTHPAISDAVVSVRDVQLIAYPVAGQAKAPPKDLQAYLQERLPTYMVPSAFHYVDAYPLTPSGKVDRKALPDSVFEAPVSEAASTTKLAETETEKTLLKIWKDVLGRNGFGVADDFFALGGHSLLAVRMGSRVEKQLGVKMPIATLFRYPTIHQLAANIEKETKSVVEAPTSRAESKIAFPVQPEGDRTPFFCMHGGDGGILFYRELAMRLPKDRPFYALEAPFLSNDDADVPSVEESATRYLEEIRTIQPTGPYLLGGYSYGGLVAYEMAQILHRLGEEVEMLAIFDTDNPARPPKAYGFSERISVRWKDQEGGTVKKAAQMGQRFGNGVYNHLRYRTERFASRFLKSQGKRGQGRLRMIQARDGHERAMDVYVPQVYPGKMHLFLTSAVDDKFEYTPLLGWEDMAEGGIDSHLITGSHLEMFEPPHVDQLASKITKLISEVTDGSATLSS